MGGTLAGEPNVIAFNGVRGVFVSGGTGNAIFSNSIFSNGGLGIDLGDPGVTPNDSGDGDTGPNNLQNFPVLTSASAGGGSTTIQGSLNSTPSTNFRLEFFASMTPDPTTFGEGQSFLGNKDVMTDATGNVAFTALLPVLPPSGQTVITSTATDTALANTSEFSNSVVAPTPTPTPGGGTEAHGSGSISVSGGQASFSFSEQQPEKRGHHFLTYGDPAHNFSFNTKKLGPVTITGNHAQFTGTAKLGKHGPTISFTVDVYDNGPSGDQFFIRASNGYSAGGTLTSGGITIQ